MVAWRNPESKYSVVRFACTVVYPLPQYSDKCALPRTETSGPQDVGPSLPKGCLFNLPTRDTERLQIYAGWHGHKLK